MPNSTRSSKGYTLDAHTGYSKEQMGTSTVWDLTDTAYVSCPEGGAPEHFLLPWSASPGLVSDLWLHLLHLLCPLVLINKAGAPLLPGVLAPSPSALTQKAQLLLWLLLPPAGCR